jgi:hypothetical protein
LLKRSSQGGRTSQGFTLVYWIPQEHRHTPTGRRAQKKRGRDEVMKRNEEKKAASKA